MSEQNYQVETTPPNGEPSLEGVRPADQGVSQSSQMPSKEEVSSRSKTVTMTLRYPDHLHTQIQQAAKERNVSFTFLALRLQEAGLEQLVPADQVRWTR